MTDGLTIKRGVSQSNDPAVAAQAIFDAVYDPGAAFTIFFCSPEFDLPALAAELNRRFAGTPLIGCTTAGEIAPIGYLEGAITAVSVTGPGFEVVTERVDDVKHLELAAGDRLARLALAQLSDKTKALPGLAPGLAPAPPVDECFGFLLVDGLSMQEELLVSIIYRNLGGVQLFGGSAGDGTRFQRTHIFHDGEFRSNCGVLTLVHCAYPFRVFKTEHFVSSSEKMVVTKADPAHRIVTEINGEPAAREYAERVGLAIDKLTPLVFASHPVVVKVGGQTHVRSIQKVNDDESLTFFCAIDEGIVLTVAEGVDMVKNLEAAFAAVEAEVGPPQLILGCDCILRFIEAGQRDLRGEIGRLMAKNSVIGFATYGEQYNAMHVNQTFTAVAIGARPRHDS